MKIPLIKATKSIAFKSIAVIVLMLVVFSIVICAIGYNGFGRQVRKGCRAVR